MMSNWRKLVDRMTPCTPLNCTRLLYSELEEERAREEEEASAEEQLSSFLAVWGADVQQVEFCRQAAAELQRIIATLVSDHVLKRACAV